MKCERLHALTKIKVVLRLRSGPGEAQGHTPHLLLTSADDNTLFTADGEEVAIGPDKLRITGTSDVRHLLHFLRAGLLCGFGERNG